MRNFILLLIASFAISGCLNNDVLDKDLEDTNFKESDFYTSGNFDSQFSFTIEDVQLKTIVNPTDPSDTLCVPTYTLRLNDNFVQNLEQEWSDQVILELYKDGVPKDDDGVEFSFTSNYGQSFQFTGKAIECNATSSEVQARLFLIAPNTGRATASILRKIIPITFTP